MMDKVCGSSPHILPVRVYYEDTDAGGIVYHASYLRFAERARSEMMRSIGAPVAQLAAETGVSFAVRHCTIDYRLPARLDDALVVRTLVNNVGGASIELLQDICRDNAILVSIVLILVAINPAGRPVRLPDVVRQGLDQLMLLDTQA